MASIIKISGALIPSTPDTLVDTRTRISTLADMESIDLPYLGMLVYCLGDSKYYKITGLKPKIVGKIQVPNALVDTYEEFKTGSEPQAPSFPDVTIYGQPTINGSQVGNFSEQNYLQLPFVVDFAGRPWQIDFAFTTGADVQSQQNILDSEFGLAFAIAQGKMEIAMSSDGSSWNLGAHFGSHVLDANSSYLVRIIFDGAKYEVLLSTDGEEYESDIVVTSSESLAPKQMIIGKSPNNTHVFGGSVNLAQATLVISEKPVWQGMTEVGNATRMALDLSNIDGAGRTRLNDIAMNGAVGTAIGERMKTADGYTRSQLDTKFLAKQDKLTPGTGISINGAEISTNIPSATTENDGLMTKEQVSSLDNKSDIGHTHSASEVTDIEAYVSSAHDSAEAASISESASKQSEASAASHDESSRANAEITEDVVGMVGVPEFEPGKRFMINEYFRVDNQMYVVISAEGYISEEFVFDETKLKETTLYAEVNERINKKEFEKVYVKLKKKVQVEEGVYEDQVVTGDEVSVSIYRECGTLYTEMAYNPLSEQFEASVLIGIDYYINIGSIEGYSSAPEIHKTAALWQRTFEYTFVEDVIEQQNVIVNVSYSGATKAEYVYVTIGDGEEIAHALENGTKCSFGVAHGASYKVRFENLADYIQLDDVTYIADGPHRTINVFYVSESFGYRILKKNGEYIPISSASAAEVDNYVGMLISTSKLYDKDHGRFVIPYNAPAGLSKQYLSQNADVGLGKFTSAALALNDTNGEYNTSKIAEYAAAKGYSSSMVSYARAQKYIINEVEYKCMVPAYAQLAEICNSTNYAFISKVFREIFGIAFPNVRSGLWWSSTEYNAAYGVYTNGASFGNNTKVNSLSVLPLLAY